MHATKTILPLALAFATGSQAWLFDFWELQPGCGASDTGDTKKGGVASQGNKCMMLPGDGLRTMLATDWDVGCNLTAWPWNNGVHGPCTGTPAWTMTYEQATEKAFDSSAICFQNLDKRAPVSDGNAGSPGSISYVCETEDA